MESHANDLCGDYSLPAPHMAYVGFLFRYCPNPNTYDFLRRL